MSIRAVLFDLDDTLVEDEAGNRTAAVAAWASVVGTEVDADAYFRELRRAGRKAWEESPARDYCRGLGIFSVAGLVTAFPGEAPELELLRQWSPQYRRTVWRKVLSRMGTSKELAVEIAECFASTAPDSAIAVRGAAEVLASLADYRLGLVTNGAADLQARKLASAGLSSYFESIVISTAAGYGKPDARIFLQAVESLGVSPAETVMVGDNRVNDIEGGLNAGMRAIWVQPDPQRWADAPEEAIVVSSLAQVPEMIEKAAG